MNATPMLFESADLARVPKLPGSLAEELAALPRVPVDGHEMYLAGAGEVDQAYVGTVYQAESGQWAQNRTEKQVKEYVNKHYGA